MPSRKEQILRDYVRTTKSFNGSISTSNVKLKVFEEDSTWQNSMRDAKGRLVLGPNNCRMLVKKYTPGSSRFDTTNRYKQSSYTKSWFNYEPPPVFGPSGPEKTELYDLAHAGLYNKLHDIDTNFAQIIAERRQTFSLIAKTATRLARAYSSLRRGKNPFKGYRLSDRKSAANIWLEYTYAWTPLLSDIHGLMELHKIEPKPFHMSVYKTLDGTKVRSIPANGTTGRRTITENFSYRVTLAGSVVIGDPGVDFLSRLGLTNPSLLAWELLPYSFVVDWFLPIGDWLKWHQGLHYCSLVNTSVTEVNAARFLCDTEQLTGINPFTKMMWVSSGSSCTAEVKNRYRRKTPIPAPNISLRFPDSWQQGVSAIALLQQRFK
uniref:Maturation protein n=1 Tax=Beihai levi-like virus 34 TaxID=1922420 RepID=A0A1L3KHR1_9VIRU|nr:hypothetical protein [Beihai levi-like virus 34]